VENLGLRISWRAGSGRRIAVPGQRPRERAIGMKVLVTGNREYAGPGMVRQLRASDPGTWSSGVSATASMRPDRDTKIMGSRR
jgi:hypothetical protein